MNRIKTRKILHLFQAIHAFYVLNISILKFLFPQLFFLIEKILFWVLFMWMFYKIIFIFIIYNK